MSIDGNAQAPGPTGNAPVPRTPLNAVDRTVAVEHLDSARELLGTIDDAALAGESVGRIAKLRLHFSELGALYHGSDASRAAENTSVSKPRADAVGQKRPGGDEVQTVAPRSGDWHPKFAEVERDLSGLIGGGPAAGAPGTAESKPLDMGLKDLNPAARKLLQQFRRELELFYAAALAESGAAAIPK
jgi:hypothetical protein